MKRATRLDTTLLELVQAAIDDTESDEEVVTAVRHALDSGKARLCGNFRETPSDEFDEERAEK